MSQTATRIFKNSLFLYMRMAVSLIISIWSTRLVLNALGASDYGIFSLVGGAIGMLSFINASMARATQRFMSFYQGQDDIEKMEEVFNVSLVLHFIIAILFVILLSFAGLFFFRGLLNIPSGRESAAVIIYGSLIVSGAFTVMSVPYDATLNAHENMRYYALVGIFESFLKIFIAFVTVYTLLDKLIIYGIMMAFVPLLSLTVMRIYCSRNYQECRISVRNHWNKEITSEMIKFAGWNFLGSSAMIFCNYGLWIVVNIFHGVLVNTALSIAQQIDANLKVFSTNMLKAFNPVIVKSAGKGNGEKMMNYTLFSSKIAFFLFSVLVIPFYVEAPYILKLWLKNVPDWTILFCRLQLVVSLLGQQGETLITAFNAEGKIKANSVGISVIYFSSIILTVVFYIIGLPPWSLYISTILLNAIAFSILHIILLKKMALLNYHDYFYNLISPCAVTFALSFLITYIPVIFLEESFCRLGIVILTGLLSSVMLIASIGMSSFERSYVHGFIVNSIQRFGYSKE